MSSRGWRPVGPPRDRCGGLQRTVSHVPPKHNCSADSLWAILWPSMIRQWGRPPETGKRDRGMGSEHKRPGFSIQRIRRIRFCPAGLLSLVQTWWGLVCHPEIYRREAKKSRRAVSSQRGSSRVGLRRLTGQRQRSQPRRRREARGGHGSRRCRRARG